MPHDDSSPPFHSTIAELTLPVGGFVSTIPPHLLDGCDDQMRWLLSEVSKNTAATEFSCHGLVEANRHLRMLNGRTSKNERGLAAERMEIETLNEKAATMDPFFRPLSQFLTLWEYTWFKWLCGITAFFLFTYVLPWYLAHPISIEVIFNKWFGS
jgi:hypothetical protein